MILVNKHYTSIIVNLIIESTIMPYYMVGFVDKELFAPLPNASTIAELCRIVQVVNSFAFTF